MNNGGVTRELNNKGARSAAAKERARVGAESARRASSRGVSGAPASAAAPISPAARAPPRQATPTSANAYRVTQRRSALEILSVISDYRGPGGKEQLTRAQLTWVEPKRVSISGINIKSSTFASDSASEFATCTTSTQKLRRWTRYVLR